MSETNRTRVIYPSAFVPITNGHLDIIEPVAVMFDEIIIGVVEMTKAV